jgi:hypothetical protein
MTGLVRGWGPVFHIVENGGRLIWSEERCLVPHCTAGAGLSWVLLRPFRGLQLALRTYLEIARRFCRPLRDSDPFSFASDAALKRRSSTSLAPLSTSPGAGSDLHQAEARTGADTAGLREFAASAIDCLVRDDSSGIDPRPRCLDDLHLFNLEGLEPVIGLGFADAGCAGGSFGGVLFRRAHGHVDVFEDAARGDAEYAVGGFDEVVAFATAMLAAEMVDEGEVGAELFGLDQEASAIRLPFF